MELSSAFLLVALITGAVLLAWIIWGFRQYSRTGEVMWLWMAVLMLLSMVTGLARVNW